MPRLLVTPVFYLKPAGFLSSCREHKGATQFSRYKLSHSGYNSFLFFFVGAVLWLVKRNKELKAQKDSLKRIRILENYGRHHAGHA